MYADEDHGMTMLTSGPHYRPYVRANMGNIRQLGRLPEERRLAMQALAHVLPFRTNSYVVEELIDWYAVPDDPIFQLTFPQPGMLDHGDLAQIRSLVHAGAPAGQIRSLANAIRLRLNPHPAGQLEHNVPVLGGRTLPGLQHKYQETLLFFPGRSQTCHAYCTYCFRWPQFVRMPGFRFAQREVEVLHEYLRRHPEVCDLLLTGGDPLVMRARHLRACIEPLLEPEFEHVRQIRIGSKALAFWPYRFVSDPDADELLRLFGQVVAAGRHLALMAHFSHPRELDTPIVRRAIERIRSTGAVIRTQAPLVRHVNDHAETWAAMWQSQLRLGCIPYYMFVERDTGPKDYFEVSLATAHDVFCGACRQVSGLARTVRGPVLSVTPGKVLILGTQEIHGEKVFVLTFLRGREREWVGQLFFAKFDSTATWYNQLRPALGSPSCFFERQQLRPWAAAH